MIWWCRSDPINFSMPYGQIADLTLTLCLCELDFQILDHKQCRPSPQFPIRFTPLSAGAIKIAVSGVSLP